MVATKMLPLLESEAAERKKAGHNQHTSLPAILPEGSAGEAREKAAKLAGTSARYVSDAKKLKADPGQIFD